jgi:hypothetical protein
VLAALIERIPRVLQRRGLALTLLELTALANQLINGWH